MTKKRSNQIEWNYDFAMNSMVHDVQIFNGIDSFMAHADMDNAELAPKMMNWLPKYDMSIPFKGTSSVNKTMKHCNNT